MNKLVNIEKLHLNTDRLCNRCNIKQAIGRVYGQSYVLYKQNVIPNGAIYFCSDCGKELAHRILDYC